MICAQATALMLIHRVEAIAVEELDSSEKGVRVLRDEVEQGREKVQGLLSFHGGGSPA